MDLVGQIDLLISSAQTSKLWNNAPVGTKDTGNLGFPQVPIEQRERVEAPPSIRTPGQECQSGNETPVFNVEWFWAFFHSVVNS